MKDILPTMLADGEVANVDVSRVLLAEFADSAPVKDVVLDPDSAAPLSPEDIEAGETPVPTKGVLQTMGLRLHRVISPAHAIVTDHDFNDSRTPLEPLAEWAAANGGRIVLASAASTAPAYSWQLTEVADIEGDLMRVLGTRFATEDESRQLDAMYPEWRTRCQKFDHERATQPESVPALAAAVSGLASAD